MKASRTLLAIVVFCTCALTMVACGTRKGNTSDEVAKNETDNQLINLPPTSRPDINPAGNQDALDITEDADKVDNAMEDTGDKIGSAADNAGNKVGDAVEDAGDKVGDAADSIGEGAEDIADDIGDAAKKTAQSVGKAARNITGGSARRSR